MEKVNVVDDDGGLIRSRRTQYLPQGLAPFGVSLDGHDAASLRGHGGGQLSGLHTGSGARIKSLGAGFGTKNLETN